MFSLRKPYYFKYFCFARFGFRQPPLGRPSEGTPEPPHRAPPGPLRMLKNDEVLPFSGACHFFPARSASFLFSHPNIPTYSFALLSLVPVSFSPFQFHFHFSPRFSLVPVPFHPNPTFTESPAHLAPSNPPKSSSGTMRCRS